MDRVICLVHSVRGVWLNMFHVFFWPAPAYNPVGLGVGCLNLCNFWILPVQHFVLVGLFLVGFGLFTACFFLKLFVESLILAQDERWRRA